MLKQNIPNFMSLYPVTHLLTSAMRCWVQREMVRSSDSPHIQHLRLSLESTAESSLRYVCVIIMCLLHRSHLQPFKQTLFPSQMATFSENPHPSDDNISGTLCSLLLSDGASDITLANLTEMIEVQTNVLNASKGKAKVIQNTVHHIQQVNITVPPLGQSIRNGSSERHVSHTSRK